MPLTKHHFSAAPRIVMAVLAVTAGLGMMLGGCNFFSSPSNSCTDDIRINVCVTPPEDIAEPFVLVRETRDGVSDTISTSDATNTTESPAGVASVCFPETWREQRILVVANGVPVDSSAWFTQAARSCGREPVTVVFD